MSKSNTTTLVRLLVVDDDPDATGLITRVATKCGYESQAITDSRRTGQMLRDWYPDVITLDLCMPHLDGLEVLSVLQKGGFTGYLVIISGQDRAMRRAAHILAEARGLKIADSLSKPVDTKMLRELLSRLFSSLPKRV